MITLTRAVQTCFACPSQWDAWDADGNQYYLRFRYGSGGVYAGGSAGDLAASFMTDDEWAGVISLEDFAKKAGLTLNLTDDLDAVIREHW